MANCLPQDLWKRQANLLDGRVFAQRYQVTESAVDRLGLETTLRGHTGCVNCLTWSLDGQLLASGSDDTKVMLWQPFHKRPKSTAIKTEHKGNIFSVKFMPHTSNATVVSGAADHQIQVHDAVAAKTVSVFPNHMKRVKRIDVAQGCPNLVWSASEDGTVMETDIRSRPGEVSVLVNLMSVMGKGAEAKCVSVNPAKPEWIAVGCNDPFVRIFDRRQMKAKLIEFPPDVQLQFDKRQYLSTEPDAVTGAALADCARYYIPGHLQIGNKKRRRRLLAVTYATFSPDGSELLVNMGGEQVYLYDVNDPTPKLVDSRDFKEFMQKEDEGEEVEEPRNGRTDNSMDLTKATTAKAAYHAMSQEVERIKAAANADFASENYSAAIMQYNQAIMLTPGRIGHPVLFANRAAAYMKRKWDGDVYAGLRDCLRSIRMDPGNMKAHLRLCTCLLELKWVEEAQAALRKFQLRFPEHAGVSACINLYKDISNALAVDVEDEVAIADNRPSLEDDLSSSYDDDEDDMDNGGTAGDDCNDRGESGTQAERPQPPTGMKNPQEKLQRNSSRDYRLRFCGHCNTTTDIKEANFFGNEGQFVVAGSDDGKFYCWDRRNTNICKVLAADESIVNCLQPHPSACLLASSGIEPVVRLWTPSPEDGTVNERAVRDFDAHTRSNQERMNADPFDNMLRDMGIQFRPPGSGETDDTAVPEGQVQCRQS